MKISQTYQISKKKGRSLSLEEGNNISLRSICATEGDSFFPSLSPPLENSAFTSLFFTAAGSSHYIPQLRSFLRRYTFPIYIYTNGKKKMSNRVKALYYYRTIISVYSPMGGILESKFEGGSNTHSHQRHKRYISYTHCL